ncbi:glutaredoxin-C9-like [Chenopodium quinoa]|uniref:Glutaredoxin domain-containing protein n=1 Tax=Chenopodium quinoa TaxID=63459 RepID=A0A803MVZ2_CHEQI|nr:glutaredoxin-C9-like [Chenopodium quinoa]
MYQALPYKAWHTTNLFPTSSSLNDHGSSSLSKRMVVKEESIDIKSLVDENAVIVFGRRGCCMSHVVRRLLLGLGVSPAVYEVDEQDEKVVVGEITKVGSNCGDSDNPVSFPAVFIGGRWFGDLDRVMATHITGELTPILKDAGALWL